MIPGGKQRPRRSFESTVAMWLSDPGFTYMLGFMLINVEFLINLFIIKGVNYTEIDWKAYMQEVSGFLNGTHDYMELKGDTGPLVYPAGFVYIFSALYYATRQGTNILFAQYIFVLFYSINLYLVFSIYDRTLKCPPYVLLFMCFTSYRIHSIYVLRLFNDPVAMLILYLAIVFFLKKNWVVGSIFFSLAVSVKMNVMLFAPGLLVLMLYETGIAKTFYLLSICASIQLGLAAPFLMENPTGYMMRAFDFSRTFMFKWTVNWRFLPEEIFSDVQFHIALLALHLIVLLLFASYKWRKSFTSLLSLIDFRTNMKPSGRLALTANQMVTVLFTSNFIGMCFSRSLHYQFYIWYYHTIPYLLWSTDYSSPMRLLLFGIIEMCWNTYPSTDMSSYGLHACHLLILIGLWRSSTSVLMAHRRVAPAAKVAVVDKKDK